jgi:hypothetical protein
MSIGTILLTMLRRLQEYGASSAGVLPLRSVRVQKQGVVILLLKALDMGVL